MCTLVILNEYVDNYPLIVAANRDERYDRRSRPPEMTNEKIVRPWDDEKNGTWTGVCEDGWFVGLTNQDDEHHYENRESRGKVVLDCLRARQHSSAAKILSHLDATRYNPFNIVFGRPGAMFLTRVGSPCALEMELLPPGVNVISNDCCGGKYACKVAQGDVLAHRIDPRAGIDVAMNDLFKLLGDHTNSTEHDPFQSLCAHADEYAFGTRSTSIITVSKEGNVEYWYSEGHPCQSTGLTLVGSMLHPIKEDNEQG